MRPSVEYWILIGQDLIKTHLCAARAATAEVRNSRRDEKIGQQGRRRETDRQTSIVSSKQGKLLKLPSYRPSIQFIQLNNNIGGGTVCHAAW